MRVLGFFLAAAGITTALVFGWTPAKKAEQCPPGYSLAYADPFSGQDQNGNGLTCLEGGSSAVADQKSAQKIGIVGIDDK